MRITDFLSYLCTRGKTSDYIYIIIYYKDGRKEL